MTAAPEADSTPTDSEVLRLADITDKEHLAGAGNWLYKIPFRGGHAVLKGYFGNRNPLLHMKKTVGNILLTGRTSHMPAARCKHERECIEVWEKHGFTCFGIHPEVVFEDLPKGQYLLFDYVPGLHFKNYFADESKHLEERMTTWRRYLLEWHRRHKAAVENDEPRLIHENGDVKHVMLWKDDFVYFDFEICFRSYDIRDLVGRELLAYLRSVGKWFGDSLYNMMMDELVAHYPDKSLLLEAWAHAFQNHNVAMRYARRLDYALKAKNKKPYSKYSVALDLKRRLDASSLTRS
jgi:hypothetical protein